MVVARTPQLVTFLAHLDPNFDHRQLGGSFAKLQGHQSCEWVPCLSSSSSVVTSRTHLHTQAGLTAAPAAVGQRDSGSLRLQVHHPVPRTNVAQRQQHPNQLVPHKTDMRHQTTRTSKHRIQLHILPANAYADVASKHIQKDCNKH